jgi:hypothetical protein
VPEEASNPNRNLLFQRNFSSAPSQRYQQRYQHHALVTSQGASSAPGRRTLFVQPREAAPPFMKSSKNSDTGSTPETSR